MNHSTLEIVKEKEVREEFTAPKWLEKIICDSIKPNFKDEDYLIASAFEFAYKHHQGQYRKSGEPYITHPVAVANILRTLGGDSEMISAALLHDVVEDTPVEAEHIEEKFGSNVRQLVVGVTKLSKYHFSSKTEQQAENFRRMFFAMAQDIRVIIVKLADRLHNMRTLKHLPPHKQKEIAIETREIFAPLANRLGMWRFKWELEDLAFKYLEPEEYKYIQHLIAEKRASRESRINQIIDIVNDNLIKWELKNVKVKGRPKHLYGIYQKMQRQQKEFKEIYDIAALRIIVKDREDCYRALAVVHDAFTPIPERFKDYIGLCKPNGYQSLHTTVVSLKGLPLEIQIRTEQMDQIAEYGVAAHWKYKETGNSQTIKMSPDDIKFTFLRELLDCQKDYCNDTEYYNNLKTNLFDDEVYVFTPKGEVIALTRGATAVDFAYRIHTEVGNHTQGAIVNGKICPLGQALNNGDRLEIITSKSAHPSLDWLNFVKTPSARNRIRQWYKRSHRNENILRGKELLERELGKNGLDSLLKSDLMQTIAQKSNYQTVDDLLAALGYGETTANHIANKVRDLNKATTANDFNNDQPITADFLKTNLSVKSLNPNQSNKNAPIIGIEGLLFHMAGCCHPLPGENIIGVVTHLKGISVHNQSCVNLENVSGDRLIPIRWNTDNNGIVNSYPVSIKIQAIDRVGVFKDILACLSDQNVNVSNAGVQTNFDKPALISLTIDVKSSEQFNSILNKIRNISDVLNIHRVVNH